MIIPRSIREKRLKVELDNKRKQALIGTTSFEKCLGLLLSVMNEIPEAEKFVTTRKTKNHLLRVKKALKEYNKEG